MTLLEQSGITEKLSGVNSGFSERLARSAKITEDDSGLSLWIQSLTEALTSDIL